jgi:hypothetical protein
MSKEPTNPRCEASNYVPNVTIPVSLMKQVIYVLESVDLSAYDYTIQSEQIHILFYLKKKQKTLNLRESYKKLIHAGNEISRDEARIEYLKNKAALERGW